MKTRSDRSRPALLPHGKTDPSRHFLPKRSEGLAVGKHCEYAKGCPNKVTHSLWTKFGDFWVCSRHAKEAEGQKEVRYIEKVRRNPGSAWHNQAITASESMERKLPQMGQFYRGMQLAHINSVRASEYKGMPNPRRRKRNPVQNPIGAPGIIIALAVAGYVGWCGLTYAQTKVWSWVPWKR